MYEVYLSVADKHVYEWAKTKTPDESVAKAAFRELVGYEFLNQQPYQVTMFCNDKIIAQHRFDSPAGSSFDWSGQTLPIHTECPENG